MNLFWVRSHLYVSHPIPLQPALSLYMMVSCWTWITRLLNDERAGWLSCSLAWLIIRREWGVGVSPYSLWVILGRVSSPCLPRCSSNIPPLPYLPPTPHPPNCFIQWLGLWWEWRRERERESCGLLKHVVFSFHFHSRDYIWLNSENPKYCIITVWFLIPCAFQYPKGKCFNAYLLLSEPRERTFYSRAMECWIKWWFSCTNIERGFQEKQFPLHCLSKTPPKQLVLSQRASEALDQY